MLVLGGTTRFTLERFSTGIAVWPLPVGGDAVIAGTRVRRIEVTDSRGAADPTMTALRLSLLDDPERPELVLEAPGTGPVWGVPLVADGRGSWGFRYAAGGLSLEGRVLRQESGVEVVLESGSIELPGGTVALDPADVVVPR